MKLKRLAGSKACFIAYVVAALALFVPGVAIAEKLSGTDAIKAVIGKPVIVESDGDTLIFNFDSEFDFRLKRPAPANDEIKGRITRGIDRSKVCFSFGGVIPARCFQLDLDGSKFVMTKQGGEKTVGVVMSGLKQKKKEAAKPVEEGDPRFCKPLRAMAGAAVSKTGLQSLVAAGAAPINPANGDPEALEEIFPSSVRLGDCLVDPFAVVPRHNCVMPMKVGDPEAVKLYLYLNQQVQLCLGEKIFSTRVEEPVRKSKADETEFIADSKYRLKKGIQLSVELWSVGRCTDIIFEGCELQYGVYVNVEDTR